MIDLCLMQLRTSQDIYMEPIKLNLVDDIADVKNPADGLIVIAEGKYRLIWICPSCSKRTTGKHEYNKETQSLYPSIVHNTSLGGCGFHGWLIDGWFKDA